MALEQDIEFLDRIPTLHLLGKDIGILAISVETMHFGAAIFCSKRPTGRRRFVVINGSIILPKHNDRGDDVVL
jgi:hypothetical protein